MTVKKILTAPDPFLKQISKPVDEVTKEIQDLMDDMLDTMYDAPGIGLAAVQIGVPLRVIVMDISWRNEEGIKEPLYFVNPEITVKRKIFHRMKRDVYQSQINTQKLIVQKNVK